MEHKFNPEAGAGLLFLILYLVVFLWMLQAYLRKQIKWRSRWSILFFHITIRLASQACGIGFAVLGFDNTNMFLAFLILGAEGYFTLVLCAYRFLISWQQHNFENGVSWLEPRRELEKTWSKAYRTRRTITFLTLGPLAFIFYRDNVMMAFHLLLAAANGIIISGGSTLANANLSEFDSPATQKKLKLSKTMRTAGQAVFLACNILLLIFILATARNDRRARREGRRRGAPVVAGVHATVALLLLAWIPLIVRGTYGILQSADFDLSYYNVNNYSETGFTSHYTMVEYLMGVMTEWLSCVILSATYFTSRNDPAKPPIETSGEKTELKEIA